MANTAKSQNPKRRRGLYAALGITTALGFAGMGYLALMGGAVAAEGSAYDYEFTTIDGDKLPLSSFKGKTVLLVNTASECGFTPQYEWLQALWEKYRDQGLVVLGAPSNDFGGQEPGSEKEIKKFCEVNFNVNFPLTSKVVTKGGDAHPFYQWARGEIGSGPKWNFHKYLIDPEGNLVGSYPSIVKPMSSKLQKAIKKNLPKSAS
jgi:glutathione peroxidase